MREGGEKWRRGGGGAARPAACGARVWRETRLKEEESGGQVLSTERGDWHGDFSGGDSNGASLEGASLVTLVTNGASAGGELIVLQKKKIYSSGTPS